MGFVPPPSWPGTAPPPISPLPVVFKIVELRTIETLHKRQKDQEDQHMKRKVSRLSESFNAIKDVNLQLTTSTARELIDDPLKYVGSSKRWKITSNYGDIGFKYKDDQTIAYVASRMPAVFSACHIESSVRSKEGYLSLHQLKCWILGLVLALPFGMNSLYDHLCLSLIDLLYKGSLET
ncbi:hypothetical protein HanPI659440_Chr05g0203841 [Helianthus annuus]|nr:hypothetical protein HanPI659440_Chr05g0203841 [Helianthus annuus]